MNRENCRHEWIEADKKIYDLKCKKCGLYVRQSVMSLGSIENVAPTVTPMMIDHHKKMLEDEIYKGIQKELLKPLFKSASY